MPKHKPHKGLLKRVRITGSGKVKFQRAWGRHLRSHKTGSKIRSYRLPKYASATDAARVRKMLGLKVPAHRKPPKAQESSDAPSA